jgi:hypothetical protein
MQDLIYLGLSFLGCAIPFQYGASLLFHSLPSIDSDGDTAFVVMPKAFLGFFLAALSSFLQGFIPLALSPIIFAQDWAFVGVIALMTLAFCYRLGTPSLSFLHLCLFCIGLYAAIAPLSLLVTLPLLCLSVFLFDHFELGLMITLIVLTPVLYFFLEADFLVLAQHTCLLFMILICYRQQFIGYFKGQKHGLSTLVHHQIRS